jgi:hypothetical protein
MADPVVSSVSRGILGRGVKVTLVCSCGCGADFQRRKTQVNASGRNYISLQHAGAHKTRTYLEEMCGPLLGTVDEYLDGFASQHYKNLGPIRASVCPFILFLNERNIVDLERVTPKTITQFISWSEEVEYKNAAHNISMLTGFFKWASRHGYRGSSYPVVTKWHGQKRPYYLPRPYNAEEMAFIWSLATARGSKRVQAALAVGEEAGLRLGEICRLRKEDVDLEGRRLFVRLQNKPQEPPPSAGKAHHSGTHFWPPVPPSPARKSESNLRASVSFRASAASRIWTTDFGVRYVPSDCAEADAWKRFRRVYRSAESSAKTSSVGSAERS